MKIQMLQILSIFQTLINLFSLKSTGANKLPYPLHSHEWQRQDFSLQYQYNITQASDKKKEKYHKRIVN